MAMGEPVNDQIVSVVDYLRETIGDIDATVQGLQSERTTLAVRLAALEAATDPDVLEAAEDFASRTEDGRRYEGAEDANDLIREAHARFVP